jgi:transcriptional regulator with XRE-family HTH domain
MSNGVPEINHKILGERIRSIRISKGFTSHESFANKYEISRTQYARYEKGSNLSFDSLLKIIAAFDMTVKEFFSEGFENIRL